MFHVENASKMAPTTVAERQRKYRERLKAYPERRVRYLQSERERWRKNVEARKKKAINELSKRVKEKCGEQLTIGARRGKKSPDQGAHPEQPSQPRSSRLGQWVRVRVRVKMSF